MSCVSTGLRYLCLGRSLGPLAVGETWISQGLFHAADKVLLPRLRPGTGAVGSWKRRGESPRKELGDSGSRALGSKALSCGTL